MCMYDLCKLSIGSLFENKLFLLIISFFSIVVL